jgi:dUTP pyrophosphatase
MVLKVKKLHPDAKIPNYANPGDAGMDLFAVEDDLIKAGERKVIPTGVAFALPKGTVGLVWDKSGIASKHGVTTLSGVLDEGYRGEIRVVMHNLSSNDFVIEKHMKLAQLLVHKIESPEVMEVEELDSTDRGEGGFGSSGRF